jgi:hypothetical protein
VGSGIRRAWSPPSYPTLAHFFCAIHPDNLSGLEPFQEGRTLASSDEEEGWITKSSLSDRKVFMVFIEEIPFKKADASDCVQLDDDFIFVRALYDPSMTTLATKQVVSGDHSISD